MKEEIAAVQPAGIEPGANKVEIVYFTDPLCCWSWAIEPHWQRMLQEHQAQLSVTYVMGGLLPSWNSFEDNINSIKRPAQMGPLWMQASHISGVPINTAIWHINPPASSYPACIAVKCAAMQSALAGERYLRLLRENLMLHGQDISRQDVLVHTAEQLAAAAPQFDVLRFEQDLVSEEGLEAFRRDVQTTQHYNIQRFPSLLFRRKGYPSVLVTGYKPYEVWQQALQQVGCTPQPGVAEAK